MGDPRSLNITGILFGLGTALLFLVLSLWISFSDLGFYDAFREDRQDYEYIGRDRDELQIVTKDLIRYIQLGGEERLERHFNEREIHHMRDVRLLLLITIPLGIFGAGLALYGRTKAGRTQSLYAFRKTAVGTLGVLLLVLLAGGIWMALSFDTAFVRFHEIFFWNDLWLLDPATDLMIRMLPQDLFVRLFVRILMLFLIFCGLLTAVLLRRNYEFRKIH